MEGNNLYEILGVARDASKGEIRKRYLKVSLGCHPDKTAPLGMKTTEIFKDVLAAYETLYDDVRRKAYDEELEELENDDFEEDADAGVADYENWFMDEQDSSDENGERKITGSVTIR